LRCPISELARWNFQAFAAPCGKALRTAESASDSESLLQSTNLTR